MSIIFYSVLNDLTGFTIAAFIAWKLTINKAMTTADKPANANTHHCIVIRYGKFCSQVCIAQYATGAAMTNDTSTSFKKSFDNKVVIFVTEAPSTLRTPISFILFSAI